jgi:hypothetical protein
MHKRRPLPIAIVIKHRYILDFAQLWRRYNIVYLGYPNKNGLDYGVHVWVAVGLVRPPENHLSAAALIKS